MVITRKSLQNNVLDRICHKMLYLSRTNVTGKVPYGISRRLILDNQIENPCLTRDKMNFHYRKYKKLPENVGVQGTNIADTHSSVIDDATPILVDASMGE